MKKTIFSQDRYIKMDDFRKEFKFQINKSELFKLNLFFNNQLNKIYEDRLIKSLYMDTFDFQLYNSSVYEDIDKFKIRFRNYNLNNKIFKEIKKNNESGKFKSSIKTNFQSFDEIKQFDYKGYHLIPTLFVTYTREYFSFKNLRVTLDRNIEFQNTQSRSLSNVYSKYNSYILEFKLNDKINFDIEKYFFKNPEKFSKFITGVEKIYRT